MAAMTMTTPLGGKVKTRAKWRYAVVTDCRKPDGSATGRTQCVKRSDSLATAIRWADKNAVHGTQYVPEFYVYDTVVRVKVWEV